MSCNQAPTSQLLSCLDKPINIRVNLQLQNDTEIQEEAVTKNLICPCVKNCIPVKDKAVQKTPVLQISNEGICLDISHM